MTDEGKIGNTETGNHAWRRKPRQFHAKSRRGCKTCKIRHVKCDLSQPSCTKCQSTGRTCDGYGEDALASTTASISSLCASGSPKSQCLQPFMVLPSAERTETEAMSFFVNLSISDLDQYHPSDSWRNTLMFFAQTVPAVRQAATTLALVHRNYLDRDSVPDKVAYQHYNRAIRLVLCQEKGDDPECIAIVLLVCYLFTCVDHLSGNYVQAMTHLRGGVELARNGNKATLDDHETYGDFDAKAPSRVQMLIGQVTRQIRRLDNQAVIFLVDWTPADIQSTLLSSQLPVSGRAAFHSLDQAADHLQILMAMVMRLRNAEQESLLTGDTAPPPPPQPLKSITLEQLDRWSTLFENMLLQHAANPGTAHPKPSNRLTSLLRLHHTIARVFLASYGEPGGEIAYDAYLPQFRHCVALADSITIPPPAPSSEQQHPTFTPEIGIVPVLYLVGAKCRDPLVRRAAVRILRRRPIREAVWDGAVAARVVERVVEVEEDRKTIEGMEQVPVGRRVEAVGWVHVVGAVPARVDVEYTLCGAEGVWSESLVL